ncbi:TolC family protein [Mariniphaga sediminis]|jgi:outer membrane protein TolC|uniref:TolC family protein n=2 Tax=Mariniphaga sediminis TaxID=1628158 RepID=A0A399CZM4_9BACT|nr:TolC family protein [Mariniphaga sediminis]
MKTMKQKLKTACILFLSALSVATAQPRRLSLQEAVQVGLERNMEIQNAGLERQKSESWQKEQQSRLYPQVEAYSNFNYYFALPKLVVPGEIFGQEGDIPVEFGTKLDWGSGFRATQLLYNRSYYTSLKLARQKTDLEGLTMRQKQEETAYSISQVYYLCLATWQQTNHLSVTLESMEQLLKITGLQQQNGVIRKVDHEQVLVDQNNLRTEVEQLSRLYDQQIRLLKYLTGMDPDSEVVLTDSLAFSNEQADLYLPDWGNRTELKHLEKQMEVVGLSKSMNKQAYQPTLSGFAQYYYQGQRNQFDFFKGGSDKFFKVGFVGLSLSIPVFSGFEKQAKIKQNDITLMQLQNTRNNTLQFFRKEFADAKQQYEDSWQAVIRQRQNIGIAEENYRVNLQAYQEQTISLVELLRVQNSLTEAHLSYDNALLQWKNAELGLKKSRGEILNF